MSDPSIIPITMPKWGLSMVEGKVIECLSIERIALAPINFIGAETAHEICQ